MEISRRKALYLFLSSLLGILLLLLFHRSVFVIYEILGSFYPTLYFFQLDYFTLRLFDFWTMIVAMFFGGWYGIWLGLHWYRMIYEDANVQSWFHGFVPHLWRRKPVPNQASPAAKIASMPRQIVATSKPQVGFQTFRSAINKPVWNFDDIKPSSAKPISRNPSQSSSPAKATATDTVIEKPVAKKRIAKKRAVKKRVRKVAKKTIEPEVE